MENSRDFSANEIVEKKFDSLMENLFPSFKSGASEKTMQHRLAKGDYGTSKVYNVIW